MEMTPGKIRIAVSSCLLGYDVRYDGSNKKNDKVLQLVDIFDVMAICPEYGIGMGVPRSPINIVEINGEHRAKGVANPHFDVTDSLKQLAEAIIESNSDLCGYVFKARSPSCGLNSTPLLNQDGQGLGVTSGIFAQRIQDLVPDLPVIEEAQLTSDSELEGFIERVNQYASTHISF